jgi:sugar phosphate isomerase/epimerase
MDNNQQGNHYYAKSILSGICILLVIAFITQCSDSSSKKNNSKNNNSTSQMLKPSDWKLGIQAWSFHLDPLSVALNKMDSVGVKYMEGFPGQEIGNGIDGKLDYHMDKNKREAVKKMLRKHGIKMVSYGVVSPKTDSDWVQLFKFAKDMGLKNIAAEPEQDQLPMVGKLADKYKINVALHNHAKPDPFWSPDSVLKDIRRGGSSRIGACADVGHWLESGVNPIEAMKKLKGHIIEFHLKDENKKGDGKGAHDVPLGQGVINMAGIMKQMKKQHFKGFAFIEHEYHFKHNVPAVKEDAEYFRKERKKLLK